MKNIFISTSLTFFCELHYRWSAEGRDGGPEKKRDRKGAGNRGRVDRRVDRRVGEQISQPEGTGGREVRGGACL